MVYHATISFCDRFIDISPAPTTRWCRPPAPAKKTSPKAAISGTSKETEIKLTNVARGSQEELLGDYRDFLRQHGHKLWDKNSKEALYVRQLGKKDNLSYEDFREFIETRPAETVANILICLIHQANYLLDQQLRRLEQDFLKEGGLRERMTRARLAARAKQNRGGPPCLTGSKLQPIPPKRPRPIRRLGQIRRMKHQQADGLRRPPPGPPPTTGKEAGSEQMAYTDD